MTPSSGATSRLTARALRRATGLAGAGVLAACCLLTATAQTLPHPNPAVTPQKLTNGGFDAADAFGHPNGWAVTGNATVVYRAADRTAGPGSLEVRNTVGSSVTVMSRREVATPGTTYTVTGKAKVASGTGASVIVRFYDFNKTVVGETEPYVVTSTTFDGFTIPAEAPAGADLMAVLITGTSATAGVTHVDEVALQASPQAYDPSLGSQRELFLDSHRIASAHDVGMVVHPGTKLAAPVIRADKPWEASAYTYGSVFRDDDGYKLYYTCYNEVAPNYFTCLATSKDGLTWTKPNLGLFTWKGSTANNIVVASSGTIAFNPTAPADRRYAMLVFRTGVVNETLGYYGMGSPDGLHWSDVSDKPLLLDGDVSNLTWDARTGRYIASVKKRMFTADTSGYERSAFVATSTDFLTWSRPQLGVMGDSADDGGALKIGGLESQIYGMPVLPYESVYIGVPWVFDIVDFTSGQYKTAADGPVTPELAVSRDLLTWERPTREPIVKPGLPGAWDDGALYTASNVLVDDTTISLYYAGFNNGHGGAEPGNPDRDNHVGQTGLVTWRRDGFVSMSNASSAGLGDAGEIVTKPITFTGRSLHLNADVHAGGSVKVTVLGADGTPIPGYTSLPVTGDRLDATVKFPGKSLGSLAGQQVSLRFTVMGADLYSYWVA